jgi:hypothetical protein
MTRYVIAFLLAASVLAAQTNAADDLLKLTDQLEAAIQANDWAKAGQLSRQLREAVHTARDQSMAAAGHDLADTILSWLPADTETLVVAQQPFAIVVLDRNDIPNALEWARSYVLGLLDAAEKEAMFKALNGRTVRLAALAARRFGEEEPLQTTPRAGEPAPLGVIPYQGCAVYAFADPVPDQVITRPPEDSIMGYRVWTSKGSQNDQPDANTYFVSLLKPDLMMVCNNREFFREMISSVDSSPHRRALPAGLPEWKQVDRTAPLWAVCHYSESSAALARSSLGEEDPGVTGITVEFGLTSGAVRARMVSRTNPWKDLVDNAEFHGAAKSREVDRGVWELSVEGKPEAGGMAVLWLIGLLGFVVLV